MPAAAIRIDAYGPSDYRSAWTRAVEVFRSVGRFLQMAGLPCRAMPNIGRMRCVRTVRYWLLWSVAAYRKRSLGRATMH